MCFGGKPKTPQATPPPSPAPTPITIDQNIGTQRRSQLDRLRQGLASTIKTSGRGITGSGPNLTGATNKKAKLGA